MASRKRARTSSTSGSTSSDTSVTTIKLSGGWALPPGQVSLWRSGQLTDTVVKGATYSFDIIAVNVERVPQNYTAVINLKSEALSNAGVTTSIARGGAWVDVVELCGCDKAAAAGGERVARMRSLLLSLKHEAK